MMPWMRASGRMLARTASMLLEEMDHRLERVAAVPRRHLMRRRAAECVLRADDVQAAGAEARARAVSSR